MVEHERQTRSSQMNDDTTTDAGQVLIVEDNQELADLMAAWLRDDFPVEVAYSGEEALEILDSTVDVVLLDRRMPGMSGDNLVEIIRERELGCRVVIVSAVTPDFDIIGMEFDDYLTKPLEKEELREVVEQMQTRETYDELIEEEYRLIQTKLVLAGEKSETELQNSDEYRHLVEHIAELQEQTDAVLDEFENDDFAAAFRDL